VNVNLFLAAMWTVIGVGVFLWPEAGADGSLGIDPSKRMWVVGFCVLLVGYNITRWRLTTMRRRSDEQARQSATRLRRPSREEPPNPDFDFSDRDRQDPAGPKPG
jgi:hypothetical protein